MKNIYSLIKTVAAFALFGIIYGGVIGAIYGSILCAFGGSEFWRGMVVGSAIGFVLGAIGGLIFGVIGGMSGNIIGWSLGGLSGGMVATSLPQLLGGHGPKGAVPRPLDTLASLAAFPPVIILGLVGAAVGSSMRRKSKLPLLTWLRKIEEASVVFHWPVWLCRALSFGGIAAVAVWATRCPDN